MIYSLGIKVCPSLSTRRYGASLTTSISVSSMTNSTQDFALSFLDKPERLGLPPTYCAVCSFLIGLDHGANLSLLLGFREWLIVRLDGYNNMSWPKLVMIGEFGEDISTCALDRLSPEQSIRSVRALRSRLQEFFELLSQGPGIRGVFAIYEDWLRGQDWYTPARPDWVEFRDHS
jgi:hypothetical protein